MKIIYNWKGRVLITYFVKSLDSSIKLTKVQKWVSDISRGSDNVIPMSYVIRFYQIIAKNPNHGSDLICFEARRSPMVTSQKCSINTLNQIHNTVCFVSVLVFLILIYWWYSDNNQIKIQTQSVVSHCGLFRRFILSEYVKTSIRISAVVYSLLQGQTLEHCVV